MKKNANLFTFLCVGIILVVSLLSWLKTPMIRVSSVQNAISDETVSDNVYVWKSEAGVTIKIKPVNSKNELKSIEFLNQNMIEELNKIVDNYTLFFVTISLAPDVSTLFIDIPAHRECVLTAANGQVYKPLNEEIFNSTVSKDLESILLNVFEITMTNNSPYAATETKKNGLLIFPKLNNYEQLEFRVFSSETDFGTCQIHFINN